MNLKRAWLAVPAVVALSLGACSSGGGSQSDSNQSGSAAGSSEGVITANGTEPQNPLIPADTNEVGGGRIIDLVYAGLVYYDEDGKVHNEMAESIETTDSQVYTVTLKEGQKFSDGTAVTANSFVDAWTLSAKEGLMSASFFAPIEGASDDGTGDLTGLEVVSDTVFTITLKQPESDFPIALGYSAFAPLPQSSLDDLKAGGENPVGNGPYMLSEEGAWVHNEGISLVPNPEYTGDRVAKNGGINFVFYTDYDTAYNDLLANNLDVIDAIPDSALATFKDELGDRAVNKPAAVIQSFTIPESLKHFEGEEGVLRRQALSMAIDREEITKTLYYETRTPATEFTSPVVAGYSDKIAGNEVLKFDAAKAKELWAQADAISPWEGTFQIGYNSDGPHQAWVDALTNQIKNNLGIDASGAPYPDFKSLRDEVTNRTITTAFRTGWQGDYPSAYNFLFPLYATGASANDGDYSNPDFDALLEQAAGAASQDEANKFLEQSQEILLQELPAIPLWYQNGFGGFSENVENVAFGWNSVPLYYQISTK